MILVIVTAIPCVDESEFVTQSSVGGLLHHLHCLLVQFLDPLSKSSGDTCGLGLSLFFFF